MKINTKKPTTPRPETHGGSVAMRINPKQQLHRSVMTNMLWEDNYYEDGQSIAERIQELVPLVKAEDVAAIAVEAREQMKLRHVPLLLVREMARYASHKHLVSDTLIKVIQRPDELSEFLAIYWKDGRCPISAQVKRGLAKAFTKFNEYSLAKYNRQENIKLRDILFLTHAKPINTEQEEIWKRLVANNLKTPDTWEVSLSASHGENKKDTWERLLREDKLGALALIRNLRNMIECRVDENLIRRGLKNMKTDRVLPFRFITAAKYAPQFETELEQAMFSCLSQEKKLTGKTVLIVDVSGSMTSGGTVSSKSELSRLDAAGALAMLLREVCEDPRIYATAGSDASFVHKTKIVPSRRGFALADVISKDMLNSLGGGGIFLVQCMDYVFDKEDKADRIIVLTDEQDCDQKLKPEQAKAFGKNNYLINVSSNRNGVGYGKWTHIDGWSEAIVDYILMNEQSLNNQN